MSAPAPLGLLFLAMTERGLRHIEFMDRKSIKRVIAGHEAENPGAVWEASLLKLKPVVDQFEAYFCGALTRFEVPLDPAGSQFQLDTWNALREIPFGETRTYGEIARAIGQPRAARAVGLANHDNPLPIIVPCHRVIGADGSLTGYGGGLPRKRWLLKHEARFVALDNESARPGTQLALPLSAAASRTGARGATPVAGPAAAKRLAAPAAIAASRSPSAASTPARTARAAQASTTARRTRGAPPARGSGRRASAPRTGTRSTARRHAR